MKVDVVLADAKGTVLRHSLDLPEGATIATALSAASAQVPDGGAVAVFGRVRALSDAVADGDRVEVCQPLKADPKLARRSRARLRRPTVD